MDLKLDDLTNDISLSSGDLVTVTGLEEAGQRIRDRLKTFITEWFLDLSYGVDYLGKILVKNPRTGIIAAHFRSEILKSADGQITSFSSENPRSNSINFISFFNCGDLSFFKS